jgi:hypothetical protein
MLKISPVKTTMKEIEDTRRWKGTPCSTITNINITELCHITESDLQICAIFINILMLFFTKMEKVLKFEWKHRRLQIAKAILSKTVMLEVSQYLISNSTTEP